MLKAYIFVADYVKYKSMTKTITQRKEAEQEIRLRYLKIKDSLNERALRLFSASEAMTFGWGGISAVHRATGLSVKTVRNGIKESQALERDKSDVLPKIRSRRAGGGRKKLKDKHPNLLQTLQELVESTTRGDPMAPLLWTARSQRNLEQALRHMGYRINKDTVARLLKELGYSLQGNKKCFEGSQHPDRNAQFEHINETIRSQLQAGEPAVSVDTKKKELVGNYRNSGQELRPVSDPELVSAYDFQDKDVPKAVPYGVYDLAENEAWVSVGISHDTAQFAVATLLTWWNEMGKPLYPNASALLIMCDGGGSNGYRTRLWKWELQGLANKLNFPIKVCHLPPGTSKSLNRRRKPYE